MNTAAQPRATQCTPPRAKRMTVAAITRSTTRQPPRLVVYGVEGIGKSTFASQADRPVFLGPEDGTPHLEVDRFPVPEDMTWPDVLDAIDDLIKSETPFRTFVVDTVDWIEPMIWATVCQRCGAPTIEEVGGGFQKGYKEALIEWRLLLSRLEELRTKRGMSIILLGHHKTANFKNPEGLDYIRFVMKIDPLAAGLLKEWCDAVFFANYESFTKGDKKRPAKGISTGARYIHTQWCAAWDAKTRYALPEVLPLDWSAYQDALAQGSAAQADTLLASIEELIPKVDTTTQAKVRATVDKATSDPNQLAKILNRLQALTQETV